MTIVSFMKWTKSKIYNVLLFFNPAYLFRYLELTRARITNGAFTGTMPGTGSRMNVTPNGYFSQHYLSGRPFEPELIAFIKDHVHSGMTVYDIGANIGYFTLLFAKLVAPDGSVVAFEPGTYAYRQLDANISLNGFDNVTAFQHPLGDSNSLATYYEAATEGYDVYNSFTSVEIPQVAGSGVTFQPRQVQIHTLDSLIDDKQLPFPDFIKMDVEGYEMNVIEGMGKILCSARPLNMAFEFSVTLGVKFGYTLDDILVMLKGYGFSLFILEASGLVPIDSYDLSWPGGTLVAMRR